MSRSEHSNTASSKSPLCEFAPSQCTLIPTSNTQDPAPYTPHPLQYAVIHVSLSMRLNSVSTPYIQFEMPSINHTPGVQACGIRLPCISLPCHSLPCHSLPCHSYGRFTCPAYRKISEYPIYQIYIFHDL